MTAVSILSRVLFLNKLMNCEVTISLDNIVLDLSIFG